MTERGSLAGFAIHDLLPKPLNGSALLAALGRAGVVPEQEGTVLVVDDDPGSLKLMSATLAQLGYKANCVGSGEEALRSSRESPPLAVVLDLLMPEMDGFQFLDRFRQIAECPRVPVIVWTIKDLTAEDYARLNARLRGLSPKAAMGLPTFWKSSGCCFPSG